MSYADRVRLMRGGRSCLYLKNPQNVKKKILKIFLGKELTDIGWLVCGGMLWKRGCGFFFFRLLVILHF